MNNIQNKKGKKKNKRNVDDITIATDVMDGSSTNYSVNTPVDDNGKHRLDLVPLIKVSSISSYLSSYYTYYYYKDANNLVKKVKGDRDMVVQYLESKPIYMVDDDDYFFQACQSNPMKRTTKKHILEFQENIARYQELEIESNMSELSDSLMFGSSVTETQKPTKRRGILKLNYNTNHTNTNLFLF